MLPGSPRLHGIRTAAETYYCAMQLQPMSCAIGALAVLAALYLPASLAQQESQPAPSGPRYEDDSVFVRIVQRSPEQLTAFYLGRQFNRAAIEQILDTCFVTPIIRNKTFDVLWLELDDWRFSRGGENIPRIKRDYWPDKWEQSHLPQAQRSTFGWTLMPELRDLRLDESVGGSVVIPWQEQPFTLIMNFGTGADQKGPLKTIVFEDLECVSDSP
jgi:hypothetical protein